ncbi:MAG TPA: DUF3443 domain-containing protein [Vicinamibacterales bacterium]|nr:DUF3443 domain-containing protein [Vicinamibacterales bacterium]
MTRFASSAVLATALFAQQLTPQCSSSSSNMQSVVVNEGPDNSYVNGLFTTVTVCVPGTSTCQTIDGVLVDTGSSGLRILASKTNLSLPSQTASNGGPIVECAQFQDGFTWGAVATADVKLAGESASNVPIQMIGEGAFPNIPKQCTSTGAAEDTLDTLGANGILGVGVFKDDCGPACASIGSSNPGFYYSCPSTGCTIVAEPDARQLQNPVWMFSKDNNGVVISLPAAPANGAASLTGALVFGIGTQLNNRLGSAQIYTTDNSGNFTTVLNGRTLNSSFIDSGSNGYFFLDAGSTGLPVCPDTSDFYCPRSSTSLSATTRGANGVSSTVAFSIGNGDTLLNNRQFSVFGDLGGPDPGSVDWGLPFFYGRNIFTAIESQSTPGGPGPYWAY